MGPISGSTLKATEAGGPPHGKTHQVYTLIATYSINMSVWSSTTTTAAATQERPAFLVSSLNSSRVASILIRTVPARRTSGSTVRTKADIASTSCVKPVIRVGVVRRRVARVTPAQIKPVLERSKPTYTAVVFPIPVAAIIPVAKKAVSTISGREKSFIPRFKLISGLNKADAEERNKLFAEFIDGSTGSHIPRLVKYDVGLAAAIEQRRTGAQEIIGGKETIVVDINIEAQIRPEKSEPKRNDAPNEAMIEIDEGFQELASAVSSMGEFTPAEILPKAPTVPILTDTPSLIASTSALTTSSASTSTPSLTSTSTSTSSSMSSFNDSDSPGQIVQTAFEPRRINRTSSASSLSFISSARSGLNGTGQRIVVPEFDPSHVASKDRNVQRWRR